MGYHSASDAVRDSVPIDWEIKQARQMIEDLKPEISKNLQVVAREEVGVQRLAAEIKAKETQLAKSRNDIMRLKGDLESGSVKFVYAGRSYSEDQVKEDLSNRFKQFQVHEETTGKLNQVCRLGKRTSRQLVANSTACWLPNGNWKSTSRIFKLE